MFTIKLQVLDKDAKYPANAVMVRLPDGQQVVIGTANTHAEAHDIINNSDLSAS